MVVNNQDLRALPLIPAWLIVLKKVPIIKEMINATVSTEQFGFKEGGGCHLIKLYIAFTADTIGFLRPAIRCYKR